MATELRRYSHYVASVEHKSALLLNAVLLYLIVRHSKFESSTYKYILGLACINDILLALTAMVCEPVSTKGKNEDSKHHRAASPATVS